MKKLAKEFKEKWVNALRSGEYKQGKNALHNQFFGTYCCLGVAEDILKIKSASTACLVGDGFPEAIRGAASSNDLVALLTNMNDNQGKSFSEIADYIEANL